jgi:hypothetical protein
MNIIGAAVSMAVLWFSLAISAIYRKPPRKALAMLLIISYSAWPWILCAAWNFPSN